MILNFILFFAGFVLLIAGANYLVQGASDIGKKFNISNIVVGMVIVGFGTSVPELVISVTAVLKNSSEIAISNVIGSNITNILLILGVLALITNVKAVSHTIWIKVPFVLFSVLLIFILSHDNFLFEKPNLISLIDGIILLILFLVFLVYLILKEKKDVTEEQFEKKINIKKGSLFVIAGIAGVYFGGDWVVDNAIKFARDFGLREGLIGATVLAVGSSLPELISSVVAIIKKNEGIAIGNIIGSNIFNTLLILGIASMIQPLNVSLEQNYNIIINIFVIVLFFVFLILGRYARISKLQGVFLILLFVGFIVYQIYL